MLQDARSRCHMDGRFLHGLRSRVFPRFSPETSAVWGVAAVEPKQHLIQLNEIYFGDILMIETSPRKR